MILLTLYATTAVFGGILIGASAMGIDKSHEAEMHADVPLDHGPISGSDAIDHEAGHGEAVADIGTLAAMLLSMRFWTFFLGAFGLTGSLLHLLGISGFISLPVALVVGALVGVSVATLFRMADRRNVGTIADLKTLMGKEGVVLLSISPSKPGKIRIRHDGGDLDLLATTRDHGDIAIGLRVLVVDMKAGQATVTAMRAGTHATPAAPATA